MKKNDNPNIILLRPEGHLWDESLSAIGVKPHTISPFEISPIQPTTSQLIEWQTALIQADWVIAASKNAMRNLPRSLLTIINANAKIVTLGQATSAMFEKYGWEVFYTGMAGETSESLLEKDFFQKEKINGKKIVILAGMGGRRLLSHHLKQRGAIISALKVYQLLPKEIDIQMVKELVKAPNSIWVSTSVRGLKYFWSALPNVCSTMMVEQTLIVFSRRMKTAAQKLGWKKIEISKMGIEHLIETVKGLVIFK